jgi:hypothetical protein
MYELIDLGMVQGKKTYAEVIEYYEPRKGWMNLNDYIIKYHKRDTLEDMVRIFQQIVTGIVHLFNLGISHSDLKGNYNIY